MNVKALPDALTIDRNKGISIAQNVFAMSGHQRECSVLGSGGGFRFGGLDL